MRKLFAYGMSLIALLFASRLSAQASSHHVSALDTSHNVFVPDHNDTGSGSSDGSTYP